MTNKLGGVSIFLFAAIAIGYTSCKKFQLTEVADQGTPVLPATPLEYMKVQTPDGEVDLRTLSNNFNVFSGTFFNSNPGLDGLSNHSITLGRVLFYDKKLSINNTIACASCHEQNKAFSDGKAASGGFGDKFTGRNSMSIINPITQNNLFWDSRASSAFDLSLRPVFNHIEMGMESDEMLLKKINNASYYASLFQNAFGSNKITKEKISQAISHFLNSLVTLNSKFDIASGNNFEDFTPMEKAGKDLFFSGRLNCTACHAGRNFSAGEIPGSGYSSPIIKGTANIGLDLNYKDNGKENGKFRIPGLRNIELTAPYMHDGRFATLEDVIEHYNSGVKNHPNLDDNLRKDGLPKRLNLTQLEKEAVVAFLKTLTDKSYTSDTKYSNPFPKN
ncbi:MAG: cytochrome-c peroxidase [Bacteroidetes bacterium]|nr:cytochrome-c peroxidase [Bacteroidota bacterium]